MFMSKSELKMNAFINNLVFQQKLSLKDVYNYLPNKDSELYLAFNLIYGNTILTKKALIRYKLNKGKCN